METRKILVDQILELELAMFLSVPTTHRYRCQEDPESFKMHRRAQFAAWSPPTLESYLIDLQRAKTDGRNLLAIKYARMDNLVPCENHDPSIDDIVELALEGQERCIDSYPHLMQGGRPLGKKEDTPGLTSFETYLRGELETYSEETLELLLGDIRALEESGSSLSEATYRSLAEQLGFDSLEALEKTLEEKNQSSIN
ncbi:MAG: hypothetical protein PWP34_2606 [Desulfuromonadales bacterium]|jgi:hypothetical protein|nr:hypothetical protein [Desulfuromonadales bacterium]